MWVERHGKTYRIRDRRGGQVITVESGYATKTAAKNAKTHLRSEQLRGIDLIPRGGRTLLREWIAVWQPLWQANLKSTSAHSELGRIRNHILPLIGDYALDELDALAVQQWVAALQRGTGPVADPRRTRRPLAAKTVRNCHGLLFTILQAAVGKLIAVNPCKDTALPERIHKEMRFLTKPEFERLLRHTPEHWRPLVLLLGQTGLRWGEAIGLKAGRVDILAKPAQLRVEEQLQETAGNSSVEGGFEWTSPKTKTSRRTVTFGPKLAHALAPKLAGKRREEPIFTAPQGGLVATRNFRRTWLKICKRAGLEGLRVHDLRHTHASWLIADNRPLTAIQKRLGHSSIVVTSDLYGHLLPGVDAGILATLDRVLDGVDLDSMPPHDRAVIKDELVAELADDLADL